MSRDFKREYAELEHMRRHNPACERCGNHGWFICRNLECPEWTFSGCKEGFTPSPDPRRPIKFNSGRYYMGNDHSHACRCTLSGWDIYLAEREARAENNGKQSNTPPARQGG